MTFDEYQQAAMRTARSKDAKDEFVHLVLGLVGESGEIAEKVKKLVRDDGTNIDRLDVEDIKKEIGDVMWYAAVLANYLDISFDDVAKTNIEKLASRKERGVLQGSGDNR